MPITLQPSTLDLITERMRRDGYGSPDVLVREALAWLPPKTELAPSLGSGASDIDADLQSEELQDFSYESVPLKRYRTVDAAFVKGGKLPMVPFDRDF